MPTKVCGSCLQEKPIEDFWKRNSGRQKGQCRHDCKECSVKYTTEWARENKDRIAISSRKANLKRNFGITEEQYNVLLKQQNYRCAICDKHQDEFKKRLAVDHNHFTKEIRGLLCSYCNHNLVARHRDGSLLRKMADYVEQGTGLFVPKKKRPVKRKRKSEQC